MSYSNYSVVTEPTDDMVNILTSNWASVAPAAVMPTIGSVTNYRSIDMNDGDWVLVDEDIEEADSFFGLGAVDYKRDVIWVIKLKTGKDFHRLWEITSVLRRIIRNKNWWGGYMNLRISRVIDLSDRERKIWSFVITVTGFKCEIEMPPT